MPIRQGKELREIHAILTETLACFLPGKGKDLSAPNISESTYSLKFLALPVENDIYNQNKMVIISSLYFVVQCNARTI